MRAPGHTTNDWQVQWMGSPGYGLVVSDTMTAGQIFTQVPLNLMISPWMIRESEVGEALKRMPLAGNGEWDLPTQSLATTLFLVREALQGPLSKWYQYLNVRTDAD